MDVNCRGSVNCYLLSGTNGVLSESSQQYQPAYGAAPGCAVLGPVYVSTL
jgi:hypothetical protein